MRKATDKDYIAIQGGMPIINRYGNNMWEIAHRYNVDNGKGAIIVTHKDPNQGEGVILILNDEPVEFNSHLMFRFHGIPCEKKWENNTNALI